MRDPDGRSRGFTFLTFEDSESVNAVQAREHVLDGKTVGSTHGRFVLVYIVDLSLADRSQAGNTAGRIFEKYTVLRGRALAYYDGRDHAGVLFCPRQGCRCHCHG